MGHFAARREKLRRCFKQQSIDALLVTRRDRAQEVGDLVKQLEKRKREDLL